MELADRDARTVCTFDWAVPPSNSALAYQVKLSNVIPAPGALALLALAGFAGRRHRD